MGLMLSESTPLRQNRVVVNCIREVHTLRDNEVNRYPECGVQSNVSMHEDTSLSDQWYPGIVHVIRMIRIIVMTIIRLDPNFP